LDIESGIDSGVTNGVAASGVAASGAAACSSPSGDVAILVGSL
jgi:hypothetical protein